MPEKDASLPTLFDEWAAIRQRRNLSEGAFSAVLERMAEIETEITAAEAAGFHALLVKARMALYFAREGAGAALRDGRADASRDILASLVRDLRRLAGADPDRLAVVAAAGDAALFALAERRQSLDAEANARPPGLTNDESEARVAGLSDAMIEIEDEMAERPAATLAGAVLKLQIAFKIMAPDDAYSCGRLELAALDDLERLIREGRA